MKAIISIMSCATVAMTSSVEESTKELTKD